MNDCAMGSKGALITVLGLVLASCSGDAEAGTPPQAEPVELVRGEPLAAPVEHAGGGPLSTAIQDVAAGLSGIDTSAVGSIEEGQAAGRSEEGVTTITWMTLNMQDLPMEDMLDAMLYPDEYPGGEFEFPDRIKRHDGQRISIVGYMIPIEWKKSTVPEFMLVRDLLGCCFGGSPQPDEWISVRMVEEGAEYFPYIPVVVTGKLEIDAIEDEAGYAAGCFHIAGESVVKD